MEFKLLHIFQILSTPRDIISLAKHNSSEPKTSPVYIYYHAYEILN